jgi:hypothetical protein
MPRLVGKKSNTVMYVVAGVVAAAVGAVALDYFGIVDFIPNFGKDTGVNRTPAQTYR